MVGLNESFAACTQTKTTTNQMKKTNIDCGGILEYASLSFKAFFSDPSERNTPELPTSVSCLSFPSFLADYPFKYLEVTKLVEL